MAHNLETKNGNTSFVAKGERAWHGLGTYVNEPMTAQQVIQLSGMDWEVEKRDIYFDGASSPFITQGGVSVVEASLSIKVPSHKAVVRTDTQDALGIVSKSYTPVQNRDCFGFFDSIIDREEAIYETAGVLGKGERVFLTAKLPDDIRVNNEVVESYILLTNGHDGMNALRAGFTNIRVVCNNTLTAALGNLKNSVTYKHTTNVNQMVKDAASIMGIASVYSKQLEETFNKMSKVRISDRLLRELIENVMKPKPEVMSADAFRTIDRKEYSTRFVNTVDSIFHFAKIHPTQVTPEAAGTVWGAYNAVSGYFSHIKEYDNPTKRMGTILYGTGNDAIKKAYELASALV